MHLHMFNHTRVIVCTRTMWVVSEVNVRAVSLHCAGPTRRLSIQHHRTIPINAMLCDAASMLCDAMGEEGLHVLHAAEQMAERLPAAGELPVHYTGRNQILDICVCQCRFEERHQYKEWFSEQSL
jgi:hypothetical protein